MNKRQVIFLSLILVMLVIFSVSSYFVISYFTESQEQQAQFDELADLVANIQSQTTPPTTVTDPTTPPPTDPVTGETTATEPTEPVELVMLPEYAALYERNPDIVGWMKIDGTMVNYPVMQTPDYPDYYLKRNFNKDYSARGCLYVREQCDVFAPSDNLTIYGHNMRDGSMFNALSGYTSQSYWEKHNLIVFDTLYEHKTYQIFAVFKTSASVGKGFSYHLFVDAENEAEFDQFVATCKELAFYDTGITPIYGDELITLSTCEYTLVNGRLVVVAFRIS